MKKDNIDDLRDKIDNLDDKILSLLEVRSQIVNEIGKLKDKTRGVIDASREQSVIDRILKNLKGYYSKDSIVRIWRELFHASSQLQVSSNSEILPKRGIANIHIYTGGKSTVEGQSEIIKLYRNHI